MFLEESILLPNRGHGGRLGFLSLPRKWVERKVQLVWTGGGRSHPLPVSPDAEQREAHRPVYTQWSAAWPDKGGRCFQHRLHPHLLLSSDRYNPGRARIGPAWVSAFQKKLLLTAGGPVVSRISSGQTTVFGGHLPGVTMVPSALGKWWDFKSICFNSTEGPYKIRH